MESIPTSNVGLKKMIRTTGKAKTDTTKGMVFLPKTTNKAQNTSIEIKAEGSETKATLPPRGLLSGSPQISIQSPIDRKPLLFSSMVFL